jgi:MurNAc alpha-1-phosphate uridylyltransferase
MRCSDARCGAMKAMLLAAGRGERLRPLTDAIPKALVPVRGKALIAWHLERLAAAGFRDVVVNVSHLGDRIEAALGDGGRYGVALRYSREPQPLETAGGIASALPLLGKAPFLLVNADIYCEYDFSRLRGLVLSPALAHLVLVPNPPHRPAGDFSLEGRTVRGRPGDAGVPRYTYAGLAVVSPLLVAPVATGTKAPLAPLLYAAADRGLLSGEAYDGLWQDVGTAERLSQLESLLASRDENR